jgi:FKBP-type peptidyl-prolyl cis-trans isomerase SlyD
MSEDTLIIDDQRVVAMHYQLSNGFDELIDSSQGDIPLVYMHNSNSLLPSLERELTGKQAGDHVAVTIYPEDGYGYPYEELIAEWPREAIEQSQQELKLGMRFKALAEDGNSKLVSVTEIRDDVVVLEPTPEELEQGYAVSTNSRLQK